MSQQKCSLDMGRDKNIDINVSGTLTSDAPLGAQSWFRCGGTADLLFQPEDAKDLSDFLKQWPIDEPLIILGGLANTIVRDGGVRGAVVQLGKSFAEITVEGNKITAGTGALNGSVASMAAKSGIGGLEFLSGIPGTVGGALMMNAGAYGVEMKDVLMRANACNREGETMSFLPSEMHMSYRHIKVPKGTIFTSATFEGKEADEKAVRATLREIKEKRNATQPIRENTGGSTFANPSEELRAWQVVEKVGGRDLQIGGAKMSQMHCNFMVNDGGATASDLEDLGDELIKRAQEQEGVELRWEIKRIGERPS